MQAAVTRKILNGDEVWAGGLASQDGARVDRVIDKAVADTAAQHHRARPTIPLGATFLGPGRAFMKTKIIQQGEVRCDAAQSDHRAATQEMDMATHVRRASLSHNPGRIPHVAMIHKFRIGESTEKQHALPFARAAQLATEIRIFSESWPGLSRLVQACPGHPRLSWLSLHKKDVDARDNPRIKSGDGMTPGGSESGAYFPRSQVEASGTLNRNKIKTLNDGLILTFLPLLSIQKFCTFYTTTLKP